MSSLPHLIELKEIPKVIESENVVLIPKGNIREAIIHEEKLDDQSGY